jgi:hypothetical protein
MSDYVDYKEGDDKKYELNVVFRAMTYFELVNNF